MTGPIKEQDGPRWRWVWRGWTSSSHELLEERPWTPIEVDERLCFTARDGGRWCVVWGDTIGQRYDDVYDLHALGNKPLYIARDKAEYFFVLSLAADGRAHVPVGQTIDGRARS